MGSRGLGVGVGVRRVRWAGRPPNARRAAQSMLEPGGVAQMEDGAVYDTYETRMARYDTAWRR